MIKEITNKALRKALEAEGLGYIHLYRDGDNGYHYISSEDGHDIYLYDTAIYLPFFNQQPIAAWVEDIKRLISASNG